MFEKLWMREKSDVENLICRRGICNPSENKCTKQKSKKKVGIIRTQFTWGTWKTPAATPPPLELQKDLKINLAWRRGWNRRRQKECAGGFAFTFANSWGFFAATFRPFVRPSGRGGGFALCEFLFGSFLRSFLSVSLSHHRGEWRMWMGWVSLRLGERSITCEPKGEEIGDIYNTYSRPFAWFIYLTCSVCSVPLTAL